MEPFINLVKAPRALWGINVSYFIEGLAYFGVLTILAKFLAENVQLTDMHAGWVISGLTGGITLSMLFLGGVSDKIGVRAALIISLICMVVGRFFLALADSIGLATGLGNLMFFTVLLGLFIVVIGYGMYQPAAYAGVKKFTDKKTAGMGYAMIYALMNLGAFVSGMISPPIRRSFANAFPPNGLSAVMWTYVGMTVLAVFLCIIILTKKTEQTAIVAARQANGEDEKKTETAAPIKNKVDNTGLLLLASLSVVLLIVALFFWTNPAGLMYKFRWIPAALSTVLVVVEFLRKRPDHPFWDHKFVFFIFILIPVQTLFAHNWLTLPVYIDRAFHGSTVGENFEFFSNLNPVLIFVLAPIVAALTSKINVYKMMIWGTLVMALPTFLLVFPPSPALLLTYILLMSIGEAMWQPRFLQWVAEIAPEGKTGAYMGIAQFPWFMTKVITGLYSGWMLTQYCPKPGEGEMNTEMMWLIYAFIAMASPVALILAKKWMSSGPNNSLS